MSKLTKKIATPLFGLFLVLGIIICFDEIARADYAMVTIFNVDSNKPWQAGTGHMVKVTISGEGPPGLCLYQWSAKKCVYNFSVSWKVDRLDNNFWNIEDSVYLTIPADIPPGNDYQVAAIGAGNTISGGSNYFAVTSILTVPTLISPANKFTTEFPNPSLEWNEVPGAGIYIVYNSLDPKIVTKNKTNLFDANQTYNWQVQVCTDVSYKNCTNWSEQRNFAINPSSSPAKQSLTSAESQRIFARYGSAIVDGITYVSGVDTRSRPSPNLSAEDIGKLTGDLGYSQQETINILIKLETALGVPARGVNSQQAAVLQRALDSGANEQWVAEQATGMNLPGAAYCSDRYVVITMPNVDKNKPWQAGTSHMFSMRYINDYGPNSPSLCKKDTKKCTPLSIALKWDRDEGSMCDGRTESVYLTIPSNTVPGNDYQICADSYPQYDPNDWKMNRCSDYFSIISNLKTPTLISPADKSTTVSSNPSLEWSEIPGAGVYIVYATLDYKVLTKNKANLFSNNQTYSWQVKACTDSTYQSCTDWSAQRSFTIKK